METRKRRPRKGFLIRAKFRAKYLKPDRNDPNVDFEKRLVWKFCHARWQVKALLRKLKALGFRQVKPPSEGYTARKLQYQQFYVQKVREHVR